uniref:Thyroglobulin type-1 domain-containing protein n=1 Tax=Meloidogyne hapla TaxID=6305 RepID=A0A1I8BNH8_MELHA
MNEEFNKKFGNLKDGCFPRPKGMGCRCTVKDQDGYDREKIYETEAECRENIPSGPRTKREARVAQQNTKEGEIPTATRERTKTPIGNRVDPVEERARQNYAAVIKELKNKFAGLREGCYPRPKGCLCVVGKDATGREITSRRMKDSECKCAPGERSKECPAQGA